MYFGYFWVWFMAAAVIGNPIGGFLAESPFGTGPIFYIILASSMFMISLLFICLPKPKSVKFELETSNEDKLSFCEGIIQILELAVSKKMKYLFLNLALCGMSIIYYSTLLTPIMII